MAAIIGLDLGTDAAVAAFMEESFSRVILNCRPSVALTKDGYEVGLDPCQDSNAELVLDQIDFDAENGVKACALFLKHVKEVAEAELARSVTGLVVAVPVYLSLWDRQAIRNAAKIAGLDACRVLDSTTAAAFWYAARQVDHRERHVIVFQARTSALRTSMSLTLCHIDGSIVEVLAARCASCPSERADLSLPLLLEQVATDAELKRSDIDTVVVMGAPSDLHPRVEAWFKGPIQTMPACEEAVARGAALQADVLSGSKYAPRALLIDALHCELGVIRARSNQTYHRAARSPASGGTPYRCESRRLFPRQSHCTHCTNLTSPGPWSWAPSRSLKQVPSSDCQSTWT